MCWFVMLLSKTRKFDNNIPTCLLRALKQLLEKYPLSKREQECLELYFNGRLAQTTAAALNLSQTTVGHYFENILDKLGCQFKSELHAHFYAE